MSAMCIDCGTPVDYRQKRCRKCYDLSRERFQNCLNCGTRFKASPSQKRKYCSKKCEGMAVSGPGNHFYGKHHTDDAKRSISKMNFGKSRNNNEKNGMWKGDDVGYSSLHAWITRHKPRPPLCEMCNANPPHDIANLSGNYLRDVKDFAWVCKKCHGNMDKGWRWSSDQRAKLVQISKTRHRDESGRFVKE